jgi:biopolymer transport protein ExbB
MSNVVALLVKGGPVMIPLAACSILALATILDRAWFWWRRHGAREAEHVLALAAGGKWDDAMELAGASRAPVIRVLAAGIAARDAQPTRALELAAQAEIAVARRGLTVLDTIITLSPLLGLLGTVTGMIAAFGIMSASGMNQPHAITGGVAEALIATAAGLAVAIVTLVPYNYFLARVERLTEEIERHATRLEIVLAEPGA